MTVASRTAFAVMIVTAFAFLAALRGAGSTPPCGRCTATSICAYLAFAVLVLLPAAQTGVPVALMVVFVAGVAIGPVDLLYMLVLQERVPERMFGRAARIVTTVVSGPSPLGFHCRPG